MKIFISHSSKDKRFVRKLKNDLEENYISTWVDEDELEAGDSLLDKLEEGIEDSTHFVIILSPNSVESKWVIHELKDAIKVSKKIIPIKYKECKIPKELQGLLYFDLSDEIVERRGELIEFITDGYKKNLAKLIKDLRTNKYKLNKTDISEIQKKLDKSLGVSNEEIVRLHLKINGYTKTGKSKWTEVLKKKGINNPVPVFLPPISQNLQLKQGDIIDIRYGDNKKSTEAHFVKYRRDDLKIVLPKKLRNEIGIKNHSIYPFEFNITDRTITILTE